MTLTPPQDPRPALDPPTLADIKVSGLHSHMSSAWPFLVMTAGALGAGIWTADSGPENGLELITNCGDNLRKILTCRRPHARQACTAPVPLRLRLGP